MPATLLFFLKIKKKVLNTSFTFGEPVLIQKESVHFSKFGASPVVKNLLVMQETWIQSLGQEV